MGHHLKPFRADRVDNLGALLSICNFQLLLEENGRLLIRIFDDFS